MEENRVKDDFLELGCSKEAFTEVEEVLALIKGVRDVYEDGVKAEIALSTFTKVLSNYQLQPHLLDGHLDEMLNLLIVVVKDGQSTMQLKHEAFKYLVVISHVRGYKTVVRHLPHEVSDFDLVLNMLETQDKGDNDTWSTRYMLLLWLSIIVMIPFHMSRLDSFSSNEAQGRKSTMEKILDVCKQYVLVLDSCHRPAAYLASKFFTRSDVRDLYLADFFSWATQIEGRPPVGVMAAVCWVFKHGRREDLLPFAASMLKWAQHCTKMEETFSLTHKFAMKLVQRVGLTFLKPRLAPWRYQRGHRSLADNLKTDGYANETKEEKTTEKGAKEEEEEDIEVPEELEEVVEELLQGLRHQDLIVRWSAAKGIGRLTGRLPKELGDEVVGSVLSVMSAREVPHAWHGGCLALAELGRRGLLLPSRLPEVVPIVLRALTFDEKRANLPVGAVIRDSACYVCWAFARAYNTDIIAPYINSIASALLVVTVFDREINCRRAASAAFQENVGRHGAFPHGLEILTVADFFAVGNRNNAFLNISVFIAQFEEYTAPLIDHLFHKKVDHWDISIRELAAKALHNLTHLAPGYMVAKVIPELLLLCTSIDLNGRHGSITSLGEVLSALAECKPGHKTIEEVIGDPQLLKQIEQLVPQMRQRQQFMGMGGDLMRQAVASFIKDASLANLPFHQLDVIDDWQWLLTDSLPQVDPLTRFRAVEALPAFCEHYCKDANSVIHARQQPLISLFVAQLASSTQTTRMGFALALGSLPAFMFSGRTAEVVTALGVCSQPTEQTARWAESRRDALIALAAVCASTGITCATGDGWYAENYNDVFRRLLGGLNDYTRDSRGDVGAWVREASMAGLQTLVQLVLVAEPCQLTELQMGEVLGRVAQNAIERIDRTRKQAGRVFSSLIHSLPDNMLIPEREALLRIFPAEACKEINWSSEVQTFPLFTQMLELQPYTTYVLHGLVASVGGVTESLVKHSSSSLFSYLRRQPRSELKRICECILEIFRLNQNVERITLPLLRFLDRIFNSGVLSADDGTLPENFALDLVRLVVKETAKCSAPVKLLEAIPVLCQVSSIKAEKKASDAALSYLVVFLCHRFPRVRAVTAEQMYEAMIVAQEDEACGGDQPEIDAVLALLSDTNWTDESIDKLRPVRNEICDFLNIPKPKMVARQSNPAAQGNP